MKELRNMIQEFYGIDDTSGQTVTTTYHYINKGFVKLNESGGAVIETTAYIGDKNATSEVTGYENKWEFDAEYITDDPVCADIRGIAVNQKTGTDCERHLISIDLNKPGTTTGTYLARRFKIAVEAVPPAGDPRKITHLTGNFHQLGDFETGEFTLADKTFEADDTRQEV